MPRQGASAVSDDFVFRREPVYISDKNLLKRYTYLILSDIYKYSSPWGCMTGVRPAKTVNQLLRRGYDEKQILAHFKGFYCMSDEKAELALYTSRVQAPFLHIQSEHPKNVGFYVGIPFCPTICTYCSFGSSPIEKYRRRVDEYLDLLEREIEATFGFIYGKVNVESIYIGGGTPTSLNGIQLKRLLKMLEPLLSEGTVKEFALEAGRPDSIDEEKLCIAKSAGVERISVNPQTMNLRTLDIIGRKHSPEDTVRAFELARRTGFSNINMDIIAGLPGETFEDFERTVGRIKELRPDSLTVHTLSIKRASELRRDEEQKAVLRADATAAQTLYARAAAYSMGMRPFYMYRQKNMLGNHENVCYCRPGCESPYNIHIMEEDQSIIACGCGAVSKVVDSDGNIERCFNMKGIEDYMERIDIILERKKAAFEKL